MLMPSLGGSALKADVRWARDGLRGSNPTQPSRTASANCGVVHQQKQRLLPQFSRSSVMSRGSGLTSPRSTRLTMSVSTALARQVIPTFSPSRTTNPLRNSISVRRPLLHILAHRRPLFCRGALALPEALLIAGAHRRFIAFSRARNHLGGQVVDLLKLVAQRLPNTDRFAANARREKTERIIVQHLAGGQPGAGGDPICHRVGHQLRPALAPEISGHLGAICISD